MWKFISDFSSIHFPLCKVLFLEIEDSCVGAVRIKRSSDVSDNKRQREMLWATFFYDYC